MKLIGIIIALLWITTAAHAEKVEGYVFVDTNNNGKLDNGEAGIPGVWISNQRDFVQSDNNGFYEIEKLENKLVYVVKPATYSVKDYYCPINETVKNFALIPKQKKDTFEILVVGDPQMRIEQTLYAFQEDIVTEMLNYNPEFSIILGDIADNDLTMYAAAKNIVNTLPYAVFPVLGNHDVNYRVASADQEADVFQQWWGPDYYTFNEGDVHFVVLNNILYKGWDMNNNRQGDYFGGISDIQYEWLKKDLSLLQKEQLVVLCMHIPLLERYTYPAEIRRIFSLLEQHNHILALSGHLHTIENYFFDAKTEWKYPQTFQNITVGAACGGWWCGPMDERGLPVSTCTDGSPNGYFKFSFIGNKYSYDFIPANHRVDFQMRIVYDENKELLYTNVFSATASAIVKVILEDGRELMMENVKERDPFILSTYKQRYNYDNWQPKVEETRHLWKLPLPDLGSGVHRLTVVATDVDGKQYVGYKLIKIE